MGVGVGETPLVCVGVLVKVCVGVLVTVVVGVVVGVDVGFGDALIVFVGVGVLVFVGVGVGVTSTNGPVQLEAHGALIALIASIILCLGCGPKPRFRLIPTETW